MPASAAMSSIDAAGPDRRITRSAASSNSARRPCFHASPRGEARSGFAGDLVGMLRSVTVTIRYSKLLAGGPMAGTDAERHARIAIVGTGFSGIGVAIALRREGIEDFVIFER